MCVCVCVLPVFVYCDQVFDNCTAGARVCIGALKSTNTNVLLQDKLCWENGKHDDNAIICFAFIKLQMVWHHHI